MAVMPPIPGIVVPDGSLYGGAPLGNLVPNPSGRGGGPTVLMEDNFTGANGADVNGRTPDTKGSGTWSANAGTYTIQSNRAVKNNTTPLRPALYDVAQADVVVVGVVNLANTGAGVTGVVARGTDASNFWVAGLLSTNAFNLYQCAGGVFTLRGTAAVTVSTGVNYTIRLACSGDTITATLDGGNELSFTSSLFQDRTQCGLYSDTTTAPTWESIRVTQ